MELAITLGAELTAKSLIKQKRVQGVPQDEILTSTHGEIEILEKCKLATSRDMDIVRGKLDSYIMEVDKSLAASKKKFLLPKHFKGLNEKYYAWCSLLLVFFNGKQAQKYSNAQLILYDREDEDGEDIIIAAITFTGSSDPDDLRRIAAFAKRASECSNYLVETEIVPNAEPTNRDAKMRSVLNEIIIVAGRSSQTSSIEIQLSKHVVLSRLDDSKVFNVSMTGHDGFANLQGTKDELDKIESEEERYAVAEERLGERVQQIKNANDIYFLGLTGLFAGIRGH